MFGESAGGWNGGPVCGDGKLKGGGRHGQLATGRSISMVRPLSLHNNTTINLGSARLGLNLSGNGEAVAFCGVHFFLIMPGGEILRHH